MTRDRGSGWLGGAASVFEPPAGNPGDAAFFRILRRWYSQYRYGNASTPQFVALAQQEAHMNLGAFFNAWLYQDAKPPL